MLTQLWVMTTDVLLEELEAITGPMRRALASSFGFTYKRIKLEEWIPKFPTIRQALDAKEQNGRYHMVFRVPMVEVLQTGIANVIHFTQCLCR